MGKANSLAICPGTFDPITYGHLDLIDRGLKIFDRIIIAIAQNNQKTPLFSIEERLEMVRQTAGQKERVEIEVLDGLVVDYARKKGAQALIRGIRMFSDFEYEFQMALTNRRLESSVETLFLMPNESYSYLTSRLIKEIAAMKGDISRYVPPFVSQKLKEKFN